MDLTATHSTSNPKYLFPFLDPKRILEEMADLGFDLVLEELEDPSHHKEKLRNAFLFLLEICAGKTDVDFVAPRSVLDKIQVSVPYPELYQNCWSELRFFTALRDLLLDCGYDNFSWRDLYQPNRKRYQHQLSAILNLAKYREEQLELYAVLTEPRNALIQHLDDVNNENEQLQIMLEEKQRESKIYFREMEEIMQECEELEVEIARNNKLQAAAREEATALKKQANDLKDAVSTAQWALEQAEAEEEALRSQVVSSPDRRKSELYMRQKRLSQVKEELKTIESNVQQSKTKVLHAMKAANNLEATYSHLEELQFEVNQHMELVRKLDDSRKQYLTKNKQLTDVSKQMEVADRQLSRVEAMIVQQRKQHQLQVTAVMDQLEMAKEQLLRVEKDRRENMARIEAGEAEVRAIQAAIQGARTQAQHEIDCVLTEYQQVEAEFLERNRCQMELIVNQLGTN